MKRLKYIMIITVLLTLSGIVSGQESLTGTIQYKPNVQNSPKGAGSLTASAVIPIPAQGVPYQVKVVISKKVLQGSEKNEQRYLFMKPGEMQKAGSVFTVQDGKITANFGIIDPQKEHVALFLVYKGSSSEDKAVFSQVKVKLVQ